MKKVWIIFTVLLTIILIGNCKKSEDFKEIEKEMVADVIENETVKEKDVLPMAPNTDSKTINYHNEEFGLSFTVKYSLFKNENHPLGYVIIEEIKRIGTKPVEEDTYKIVKSSDPSEYMIYIHEHHIFDGEKNEIETVTLEDETFRGVFRTAEAMVMCEIKSDGYTKEITTEQMIEARDRMAGRMYGVSQTE